MNSLVVIVPLESAKIKTIFDLAKRPKLRLVVAGPKVPIGLYTREVREAFGPPESLEEDRKPRARREGHRREGRARSEADAGFVYRTDVAPVASRARAIPIYLAQPTIVYELAIAAEPRTSRPHRTSSSRC